MAGRVAIVPFSRPYACFRPPQRSYYERFCKRLYLRIAPVRDRNLGLLIGHRATRLH